MSSPVSGYSVKNELVKWADKIDHREQGSLKIEGGEIVCTGKALPGGVWQSIKRFFGFGNWALDNISKKLQKEVNTLKGKDLEDVQNAVNVFNKIVDKANGRVLRRIFFFTKVHYLSVPLILPSIQLAPKKAEVSAPKTPELPPPPPPPPKGLLDRAARRIHIRDWGIVNWLLGKKEEAPQKTQVEVSIQTSSPVVAEVEKKGPTLQEKKELISRLVRQWRQSIDGDLHWWEKRVLGPVIDKFLTRIGEAQDDKALKETLVRYRDKMKSGPQPRDANAKGKMEEAQKLFTDFIDQYLKEAP